MDDKRYQRLLMIFVALTSQFRILMEDRQKLTKDMGIHDLLTGLTHLDSLVLNDLDQLTELEERSVALEEALRRTMIEISRSQRGMSQWLKRVSRLHRSTKKLQKELRAAIERLEGRSHRFRFFSRRKSMLESQVTERNRLRFRSCPNIPSEGLLDDSEFPFLTKWSSLNRTIEFKDSFKDILKRLEGYYEFLDISRIIIMNKLKQPWHYNFHQPQQLNPRLGHRGRDNYTLPSSQAAGQDTRSEFQLSSSDSSRSRETARNATSHHSDQSVRHQTAQRDTMQNNVTIHRATIQLPPSQNVTRIGHSGTSAQQDNESHSARVRKEMHEKVPITAMKTVSAKSSGSPSVSLANIGTAIYKTMAASCAAIFILLSF